MYLLETCAKQSAPDATWIYEWKALAEGSAETEDMVAGRTGWQSVHVLVLKAISAQHCIYSTGTKCVQLWARKKWVNEDQKKKVAFIWLPIVAH